MSRGLGRTGLALVAALGAMAAGRLASAEIIDGVAVVVNGDPIMLSEILERPGLNLPAGEDAATLENRHKTLQRAAEEAATDHLVEKECTEEGITPTSAEVDSTIEDVQRNNGNIDRATLEKALQAQGMTMPMYRDMLNRQLCQMKLFDSKVKSRIQVPEDDIHAAYSQLQTNAKSSREIRLRDIFILIEGGADGARSRMDEAIRRVGTGEEFAKVAKETGGPLAENGGDLGWMKPDDLAPELRPVLNLAKGAISKVIETSAGLHLVKVEDDRTVSDLEPYAQKHDELKNQLMRDRMGKASEDYLQELRRNADIEYKLP